MKNRKFKIFCLFMSLGILSSLFSKNDYKFQVYDDGSSVSYDTVTSYWKLERGRFDFGQPRIDSGKIERILVIKKIGEEKYRYENILAAFDTSGNLVDGGTLRNGNGTYKEYNRNGTLKCIFEILNGEFNGLSKEYDKNGKLRSIYYYYGNSDLISKDTFMNVPINRYNSAKIIGILLNFDTDGNISSKEMYDINGNQIKSEYKEW